MTRRARARRPPAARMIRGGAYKPRSSPYAFQGMGLEGLKLLRAAGDSVGPAGRHRGARRARRRDRRRVGRRPPGRRAQHAELHDARGARQDAASPCCSSAGSRRPSKRCSRPPSTCSRAATATSSSASAASARSRPTRATRSTSPRSRRSRRSRTCRSSSTRRTRPVDATSCRVDVARVGHGRRRRRHRRGAPRPRARACDGPQSLTPDRFRGDDGADRSADGRSRASTWECSDGVRWHSKHRRRRRRAHRRFARGGAQAACRRAACRGRRRRPGGARVRARARHRRRGSLPGRPRRRRRGSRPDGVDLVVLATPAHLASEWLECSAGSGYAGSSPTSPRPSRASCARPRVLPDPSRFVGGHPMAGASCRASRRRARTCSMAPTGCSRLRRHRPRMSTARCTRSSTSLGARVISVDAAVARRGRGDREPRAARRGGALVDLAAAHAGERGELMRLAAGGFKDTTRIAAGSADLWTGICLDNAEALVEGLSELRDRLGVFEDLVRSRDAEAMRAWLESGRRRAASAAGPVGAGDHAARRSSPCRCSTGRVRWPRSPLPRRARAATSRTSRSTTRARTRPCCVSC